MAIAFVQSTGRVSGSAVASVTLTLPQRPAAGNFLAVVGAVWQGSAVNINPANCSDSAGNAYAILQSPVQNGSRAYILYAQGVATIGAGSFVITVDPDGTTYNEQVAVEFSGLATSSALDQTGTANLFSQTPSVSTAGATTQADELVLAALSVSEANPNVGIDTPATPGYTNLGVNQDANATIGMSADYKIVAATGVQSAAWGSLNAGPSRWAAAIATFKAATGGGTVHTETVTLAAAPAAAVGGALIATGAVTFSATTAVSVAAALIVTVTVALGLIAGLSVTAALVAGAALALGIVAALATTGGFVYAAAVALVATAALAVADSLGDRVRSAFRPVLRGRRR